MGVSKANNKVIGSSYQLRGYDEYQLYAHTLNETPILNSFLDILNYRCATQIQPRIYMNGGYSNSAYESVYTQDDYNKYGEKDLYLWLMNKKATENGLTIAESRQIWCSPCLTSNQSGGYSADERHISGLNFDLPTEAQWEYCCRNKSTYAFPPSHLLGQTFESNDSSLDLIAWYKYRLVGERPEPERFCAWRISKMLFGISRDKEKVNNVYERT